MVTLLLLEVMNDEQALHSHLKTTEMSEELAQHAGIDQEIATRSVHELLNLVAGQTQTPKPGTASGVDLNGA